MPQRSRTVSQSRQGDRWLVPLPHPSWSGEAAMLGRPQPLIPADSGSASASDRPFGRLFMLTNHPSADTEPLVLIVPGLNNSGPGHWQSRWERELPHAERVELGTWDDPQRNTWVNRLNLAIHKAGRPVILVAHSLACHVIAWWNEYEQPDANSPVLGALLVAPPEVEKEPADHRVARFGPVMKTPLPFPSILAASRDDPWIGFDRARRLARIWKSRFVDAGWLGHINADSQLRDWPFGLYLLRQLRAAAEPLNQPLVRGGSYETLMLERGGRPAAVW